MIEREGTNISAMRAGMRSYHREIEKCAGCHVSDDIIGRIGSSEERMAASILWSDPWESMSPE